MFKMKKTMTIPRYWQCQDNGDTNDYHYDIDDDYYEDNDDDNSDENSNRD